MICLSLLELFGARFLSVADIIVCKLCVAWWHGYCSVFDLLYYVKSWVVSPPTLFTLKRNPWGIPIRTSAWARRLHLKLTLLSYMCPYPKSSIWSPDRCPGLDGKDDGLQEIYNTTEKKYQAWVYLTEPVANLAPQLTKWPSKTSLNFILLLRIVFSSQQLREVTKLLRE